MNPVIHSAELLSVGTELLLGEIVDTNSAYLAADLAERGVDVYWSQRVGDNLARIVTAIRQALHRSDLLVISGGLGPTDDDMTREPIAEAVGESPIIDPELEHGLREKFARFARHMPEKNLKQAWLIPSSEALANPIGTAPGWLVKTAFEGKTRLIITLPGPPRELKRMWTEEALPKLTLPQSALFTRTFKTLGLGESAIAERLGELTLQRNPSVATYAKRDGVHVRMAAKANSEAEARALAAPTLTKLELVLETLTWGYDKEEIAELLRDRLKAQELSFASIESISGGLFCETFSSVSGAATVYKGGVIDYNMRTTPVLAVFQDFMEHLSGAPEAFVLVMAEAIAKLFHTDIGLALYGETDESPTKDVFLAVHAQSFQKVERLRLPRLEPAWIRERATYAALSLLWSELGAKGVHPR